MLKYNMGRPRKFSLNENYFSKIDSMNKAYILGFIYADGSINKNYLSIKLAKRDIEILNFIRKEIGYGGNIREYQINNREYVDLTISSNKIINSLYNLGIIKNKTYESRMLPNYYDYEKSFILGFFDGDGSIYSTNKRGFNEYTINFSGNYFVLSELKEILLKYDITSSKIRKRYNNEISCMLDIRGNINIEKFYYSFYRKNEFSLERKRRVFDVFITDLASLKKRKLSNDIIDNIQKLYENGLKQIEITERLNVNYSTVKSVIQRYRKNG